MEDLKMSNYVLTLGNLYGTRDKFNQAHESDKVDVVIKAVLREMLQATK